MLKDASTAVPAVLRRDFPDSKILVAIPAFNEGPTIGSVVLKARQFASEVIVVDDGSKDRTLPMLRNFQRRYPGAVTVVHQANSGKAAAINRAVRYWAKGSLVMVVDADSRSEERV